MKLTPGPFLTVRRRYLPLLNRLALLFGEMDRAYARVADQYGFQCNGCRDNCCLTRFFHHTLLEYLYLVEGMRTLAPDVRRTIQKKALTDSLSPAKGHRYDPPPRRMCPLNRDGRCLLYPYRPMICRLHGLPHELHRPGTKAIQQPGCDAFFEQCRQRGKTVYIPFDRTPFYRQMAMLEKDLRLATGYTEKIKLSISQMLATLTESVYEID